MDLENLTLQTEEILELTPSLYHADIYNHSSHNSIIDISEESELNISLKLIPCQICSRTFNPVTLQKHVKICEKMATKKRNVFDSSRQRREGTELASYPSLIKNSQTQKPMQTTSPILTRKKPINELSRKKICASMRKQPSSTSNLAQISPTGTIITETSEAYTSAATSNFRRDRMRSSERLLSKRTQPLVADQCPYCERCFGVKAYDRHVEWCKEKALQASIKLSSKNEQNVAKERLEARTKYRAPCLKTKRSINREKYAGLTGDEKDSAENPNLGNSIYENNYMNSNNMSLSLTSSIKSETTMSNHATSNGMYNGRNSGSLQNNDNNKANTSVEKTMSLKENTNIKDHQIRRYIEQEILDFRLNGEKCETSTNKMESDREAIEQSADFITVADNESTDIGPRRLTRVSTPSLNDSQDNIIEVHTRNINDLLDTSTLASTLTATPPLTKSLSSLSRRKLKTKESFATINISKRGPISDDVNSAAVKSNQIPNTKESKTIKKLHPSISLPHLEQQQEQQQENNILGMTVNSKLNNTMSNTAMGVHAKLGTYPIKGPIISRPKRKILQRQQNANSKPLKAIPLLKESMESFGVPTKTKIMLDKSKENNVIKANSLTPSLNTATTLIRNKSFILSRRLEAYDPFLSAKRQLEDLCSPSTAISAQATSNLHPQTHQSPNTPKIHSTLCKSQANRMTSSIISSSHEGVIIQNSQGLLSNLATKSNFRRTSSLRGTRQSPVLSSRPFLTQKLRPSIQRGLSDEGPISTNFLKPEEYDEMPVRAVCVNDFAVSNTPRVLRRDTISSNRKNNFKTNVSSANPSQSSAYGNQEITSKFVAKTDSLTIFLKYENDVDNVSSIPAVALESPVITKELKEKNNSLSKQNSAKNIIAEAHEYQKQTTELQNSPNWSPDLAETRKFLDNAKITLQANNANLCSNNKTNQKSFEQIKNWDVKQVHQQSQPTISVNKQPTHKLLKKVISPILNVEETKEPIRLTSILDDSRSKELNMSDTNGIEFIDPKLINKYDNLPVNVTAAWTLNLSNDELSVKRSEYYPSPSECSKVHADTLNLPKCRTSQHSKVEDLESAVFSKQNSLPVPQNLPQGRNLLKRKMRLGRNQFLYDESPHIDHCSGKDEALRSSVEYDDKHFTHSNLYCTQFPQKQPYISSPPATAEIPPLPFDEFDLEGFLLSFKNDENQFPLFKDCREFLMNRSSNKHRSAIISTSELISDNTNIQTNSLQHQPQHVNTFNPTKLPNFSFQSFNNQQNTDSLLNTSSFRTKSNKESMESNQSEIYKSYNDPKSARFGADFGEVDKKKREIFISIETEQNAHGRSAISPDSLRSILGDNQNPQVEEVCDNDNKFSKIEDDDRLPNCPTSLSLYETKKLPNIQINNAKNLIQQMQESFRQMGEEASTCLRQAVINSTPRSSTASNSCFDNSRSPLSTERSEIAENVTSLIEGDSDEASSLESYPVSSQSSRRGVASKLNADSAYGSLSRQKSSDFLNLNCHQIRARPSTSSCGTNTALVTSMIDAATQHKPQKLQQQQPKNKYTSKRTHSRQFSGNSSTSGSEISLPQIVGNDDLNKNFLDHQEMSNTEQHPHQQIYDNNANKNTCYNKSLNQSTALITSEKKSTVTVETSADARTNLNNVPPASSSSYSLNSPSMTSSLKMSRFCHECGSRFLIDEAKFCMDCGVKRLIL